MRYWRASITILTLAATLLGGQTLYRCLMADAVSLNACHCASPKTAPQPAFEQAETNSCCAGYDLPAQLQATATAEVIVIQAPAGVIARLPRLAHPLYTQRTECRDSRALAPPLYQQFCRILI